MARRRNETQGEWYHPIRNDKLETTAPYGDDPDPIYRARYSNELSHFHLLTLNFLAAEVYAKYFDTSSQDPDISSLVAAIVAQLGGTNPSGPVVDGGSFETSTTSFPFAGEAGGLTQNDQTTGAPRAYLNWLVFDRNYVLIPQKSGFKRITTAAHDTDGNGSHERIFSPQITIDQPGYLYIYISNEEETQMEVFFDDFKVDHIKSPVVQMDDYYPFGLKTSNSYARENSLPNRFTYNGKEEQNELN